MLRLLESDDLHFLSEHPGVTASQTRDFRQRRATIFRAYLMSLHCDFRRITMAIRVLMVQSRHDRPDLARVQIRLRTLYAAAAVVVHARLFLYERGMCRVDPRELMRTFEAMRLELHNLLPKRVIAQV
jgi:hypothetical protein